MFGLNTPVFKIMLALSIFASGGYVGYRLTNNVWVAKTEKLKSEAAAELQKAAEKTLKAERENTKLANKMDVAHAKAEKQIRATLAENRRLVYSLDGMRDPGCGEGGSGNVSGPPAAPGGTAGCATGNRLSDEAAEFLLGFAEEADTAANYARTCYGWLLSVRGRGGE